MGNGSLMRPIGARRGTRTDTSPLGPRDHLGMVIAVSFPTWLQATTTFAAAVAAVASWIAVLQSRRVLKDSRLPLLHADASVIGRVAGQTGPTTMAMTIINGGGGLAKGVGFVLVAGGHYGAGRVGFLFPGQTAYFGIQIPGSTDARAVIYCRDQDEGSYGWTLAGEKHRFRRTRRKSFHTDTEIFNHFYPETDFDTLSEGAA